MNRTYRFLNIALLVFIFHTAFTSDAAAYLDPSSGSYALQILLAFLLGGIFFVKSSWRKVNAKIRDLFKKDVSAE